MQLFWLKSLIIIIGIISAIYIVNNFLQSNVYDLHVASMVYHVEASELLYVRAVYLILIFNQNWKPRKSKY